MTNKIQVAVILAAGMGERLKEAGKTIPKGFLRLGKRPIIEESIDKLLRAGIKQIIIVTGHHFEYYERLKESYSGVIETIHNGLYGRSGSMYSLYCAKHRLMEDFLLLESDIVYEERAVSDLDVFRAAELMQSLAGPTEKSGRILVIEDAVRSLGAMLRGISGSDS